MLIFPSILPNQIYLFSILLWCEDGSVSFGKSACLTSAEKAQSSIMHRHQNRDLRRESVGNELKPAVQIERNEEKPSTSESRPKEGVAYLSNCSLMELLAAFS